MTALLTDSGVRVKLRPDTHYAPVSKGVYWSRPGGRSFVLAGPAALYHLIDSQLALLAAGTTVEDLVRSAGSEAARPVYTHIVSTLLTQDIVFDVAAAGPVPPGETASRYADVLGYLESHCARPYHEFARIRAARIAVRGTGQAVHNLVRSLTGYGVTRIDTEPAADGGPATSQAGRPGVGDRPAPPDVAVVVDDAGSPAAVTAAAAPPAGTAVVAVLAGPRLAVVSPVLRGEPELAAFTQAAARYQDWAAAEGTVAPRPVSAALAGSLAAQAVLDTLIGRDGTASAIVVYGRTLECARVPFASTAPGPLWRDLDAADLTAGEPEPSQPEAGPPGPGAAGAGARPVPAEPDEGQRADAPLTARWTGLARWRADLDLPQLPVALATAQDVSRPDRRPVLGWGTDRSGAGTDAMLALLRAVAADRVPAQPGLVAAAGTTTRRMLSDGLLRLAAERRLAGPPDRELAIGDAGSWIARSLWRAVTEYFGIPARLWLHTVPGLSWQLVTATGADGTELARQWGQSQAAATFAALATVTAGCQLAEDHTTAADLDPAGGWAQRTAAPGQLDRCHAELLALAAADGQRVTGRLLAADPVCGPLPVRAGLVGLR
ncbi:MAG TPA: hypothetical protein VGM53_14180 [Streptosporangiaceae bacterium]|jgi:hypothetical protein